MSRHILNARVRDIEKRRMQSKFYVYVIHVSWSDGSVTIIYRRYSKFFDFHMKLLATFPDESGAKIPSHRTIPFLPGKKIFGRSQTKEVALKRMNQLDDYCKYLVKMPAKISNSEEVMFFFSPTPDDINPPTSPDPKSPKPDSAIDEISDPIQAEQYKVIADYKKQQKNEVDLETGDIVEVFEKNENGWWFVSVQESQGWAPGTFLAKSDGKEDEEESISGNNEKYITNNRYEADQEDELSFETGVVVKILKKSLDGWWQAQYQDKVGWVPATYLQPYKGPDLDQHSSGVEIIGNVMSISNLTLTSSPQLGKKHHFLAKNPRGVTKRFNTEAKPTPPRRSTVRKCTVRPKTTAKVPQRLELYKKTVANNIPKQRKRSQYRTTAAFKGHSDAKDCITFEADQTIEVIHKNEEWWFIKTRDKEGWAPASFIEASHSFDDLQPPSPPPPSYPAKSNSAIDPDRSGSVISTDSETGAPRVCPNPAKSNSAINPDRSGSVISTDSETGAPRGPESQRFRGNIPSSTGAFRPYSAAKGGESAAPGRPPAPPPAPTLVALNKPKSVPAQPPVNKLKPAPAPPPINKTKPAPIPPPINKQKPSPVASPAGKTRPALEPSVNNNINMMREKLRPVSAPKDSAPEDSPGTDPEQRKSIAEIREQLARTIVNQNGSNSPARNNKPKKQMYRTVAPFEDDEGISFLAGVEVELIEKDESGWWNVRIGSDEGWAPSNYLEPIN